MITSVGAIGEASCESTAQPELAIEHNTQRTPAAQLELRIAHGEPRIVRQRRADAGDDGRRARTQSLHVRPRLLAGHPLTRAIGERGATIERSRPS